MPRKLTQEDVIIRFKEVHGDRYDYSLVEYINSMSKVKIICKVDGHGVFEQTPNSHILKHGCAQCGNKLKYNKKEYTKEDFIKDAIKKHGNKYDYSLVDYKKSHIKVDIKCNIHGVFKQTPASHKTGVGCPECGKKNKKKRIGFDINEFILKSNIIHKHKYIYGKYKYINSNTNINIECKEHGIFTQRASHHLNGHGCMDCRLKNSSGWSLKSWVKSANGSKFFDGFKVYVIRCWNDNEEFYKIGRTYKKTYKRFPKTRMPYNYEVIKEIEFKNGEDCYYKEKEMLNLNNKYSYKPILDFPGKHECFSKIDDLTLT